MGIETGILVTRHLTKSLVLWVMSNSYQCYHHIIITNHLFCTLKSVLNTNFFSSVNQKIFIHHFATIIFFCGCCSRWRKTTLIDSDVHIFRLIMAFLSKSSDCSRSFAYYLVISRCRGIKCFITKQAIGRCIIDKNFFFVILWCDTEGILHGGAKILFLCSSGKTIFYEWAQGVSKMLF